MDHKMPRERSGSQPEASANLLLARVEELRVQLRQIDPAQLAARTGATWHEQHSGGGKLHLSLWGKAVELTLPDLSAHDEQTGKVLGTAIQALLIYHLVTTDGTPEAGQWISFSELPDGRFYNQAFQGYSGGELGRFFGEDLQRFQDCALESGGAPMLYGDFAYAFRMLPRISLGVVVWRGDEDFPSSYQVLFDAAISHHLPADACAIAGSMLTRRLIAAGSVK